MAHVVNTAGRLTIAEVAAAIAFDQPKLRAAPDGRDIRVTGRFVLTESGNVTNPDGPIAEFDIVLVLSARYPDQEPKVFEVGGRIPPTPDRHINRDHTCCVTVWEHWLACAADHSFASFLNGPLHEFFLAQYWFEATGEWPFGDRAHADDGLLEAYAEALGIPSRKEDVLAHLRLLSLEWPKGHAPCPCGSGQRLRYCHRETLVALHLKIPPHLARRMLSRLTTFAA